MAKRKVTSSLNGKVMRVLGVVIAILLAGNGAIFAFVVWPTFAELEHDAAQKNTNRVLDAIAKEREGLERVARDWSAWDTTYEYVLAPNEDYERQAFTYEIMHDLDLDLLAVYDVNGRLVGGQAFNLTTGEKISIDPFGPSFPADHPLLPRAEDASIAGILLTEHGPMLLASFPILRSTREGPVRGTFFMGRFIDASMIEALEHQTHVRFDVFRTDATDLPSAQQDIARRLSVGGGYEFDASDNDSLATFHLLPTLIDRAPLLLRADTQRRISAIGRATLGMAALSTAITSLLVMAVMRLMLTRLIVAPLNTLTDHVLMVGRTGDLSKRLHLERDDEIGVLSREFDGATMQLEQTRRRLLEQSYQSGMADIAAGVMHNIRNALSPVAVALWRLSETAATAPATRIDAAFAELKSDATAPGRRLKLVEYVEAAMIKVINRERSIAEDLKGIAEQNRHIEQILLDHAALSMGTRRLEPVDLATAVSEAARLVPAQEGVAVEVRVAPEVAHMPAVHGNPIVVTQILGNLMVNAVEAIRTVGKRDGWIEVSSALTEEDGRAMVHLTVRDNGVGIDPANLSNLFERGFSTKRGKTGGLGLHWSANSAAAIAGRMYAESDGPGAGASFHLLLPVAPELEEIAA